MLGAIIILSLVVLVLALVCGAFWILARSEGRRASAAWTHCREEQEKCSEYRYARLMEVHRETARANHHRERCRELRRKLREIESGEGGGK